MSYSDRATDAANKIVDILKASSLFDQKNVWYGDSDLIPDVPACTVQAGGKRRELAGATFRTDVRLQVDIMVYLARLEDTDHGVQLATDQLAEDVETEIHKHPDLDGLVVHGFVVEGDLGYALRNDEIMRAAKLTWEGLVKVAIHG